MNPIQELIQSQIQILLERSKSVECLEHNLTKGALREKYLIEFFRGLIPEAFSITSGVVCDAKGRNSSQLDFIIKDSKTLPTLLIMENVSVVPVESVHLLAEIKTTLRSKDLEQVKASRYSFNMLELATVSDNVQDKVKIPTVILAFNNEVSKETLKSWMVENGDIVSICVVGDFCLSKVNNGIECYKSVIGKPEHWETLVFSIQLFNWLQESLSINRGKPLWWAYLEGVTKK